MITKEEYRARRQKLAMNLPRDAVAIIPAAAEVLRNGDAHYRFRQDSDFYYLTGFNETEAVLVIFAGEKGQSYLFNRPRDRAKEQWTGKRLGQDFAIQELGIDKAYPIDCFSKQLPELLENKSAIYYLLGRHSHYEEQVFAALLEVKGKVRRGVQAPQSLHDLEPFLSEMRLFKTKAEIDLMRRAAEISIAAHKRAMRACANLSYEYQLEAELLFEFTAAGARAVAYDPIVGSGANTCILHYNANDQALKKGDLVLIDAGAEFGNYAADITRTFPINGCFTKEQRAIYELVLKAQQAGIATVKPGIQWHKVQEIMVHVLTEGLQRLGILTGDLDKLIADEAYKPFYMHSSGHWLGLDVHDVGRYKLNGDWRIFEPGMVLTVEPGLYISAGLEGVAECWWNIGVRIEDDILVTEEGHENLTAALPVDVAEIEALVRG